MSLTQLIAAKKGRSEVKKFVKSHKVSALELNQAFQEACGQGLTEVVEFLLSLEGVNPSLGDSKAVLFAFSPAQSQGYGLQQAVYNGHLDTVKVLLADGRSKPEANHFKVLQLALYRAQQDKSRVEILQYLVDFFRERELDWRAALNETSQAGVDELCRSRAGAQSSWDWSWSNSTP